jgi:hypothetical protein
MPVMAVNNENQHEPGQRRTDPAMTGRCGRPNEEATATSERRGKPAHQAALGNLAFL